LENQQRALPAGLVRTTSEKDVEWKRRSGECKVRTPQHEIKSCRSGPKTTGLKSFPNGSLCSGAHRGVAGKAGAMVGPSAAKRCPQPEAAFPLKNRCSPPYIPKSSCGTREELNPHPAVRTAVRRQVGNR